MTDMNIRWLIPFAIFLLCAQLSSAQQQLGHRYAVLVGIGNYRGAKGLDPLHADDDTEKLAALLRQQGWTVVGQPMGPQLFRFWVRVRAHARIPCSSIMAAMVSKERQTALTT